MTRLFTGAGYLLQGLGLLRQPRLRRFVVVPMAINGLLFMAAIGWLFHWFGGLMERMLAYLPQWLDWLSYLLWPLFAISVLIVVFYSFALLANLIAAPFNGLLAEAVERHLTGQSLDDLGGWKAILKDLIPALLAELRKLIYFLMWLIPLGLAFLIPGINLAAPALWMLFSAWMLALEYVDYPMANHGLLFPQQRQTLRAQRGLTLGFGGMTLLLTLIPVINFIAMPAAVAGATAMWVKEFKNT